MTGIEIVARLAQLQKQYDDAHRPTRPLEAYRRRHARPSQARLRRRAARLAIPGRGLTASFQVKPRRESPLFPRLRR